MTGKVPTIVVAALLVTTAFAAVPVAAAGESVSVETGNATDVTASSATLNGELTVIENASNATVWFEYWAADDPANSTNTTAQELAEAGTFSEAVGNLSSNTTYVVVAHAAAGNATAAGAERQFTTFDRDAPLAVDTEPASDVTDTAATLNGQLTGMDGAANATVWFEYWVQGNASNTTQRTPNETLSAPGSFAASVSGLDNDTTYAYVAYAAANNTSVSGGEVEFTTAAEANGTDQFTWDGEGPFGAWLSGIIKNLVPADGQPLGQLVSEIATSNNPGSEHRSEKANPGGNSTGPPEHAVNKSNGNGNGSQGPPDHAKNASEDKGNSSATSSGGNGNGNSGQGNGNGGNGNGQGNGNGGNGNGQGNGNGNSLARPAL